MWIEALFEAQKVQLYDARGPTVREVQLLNCTRREARAQKGSGKERRRRQRVSRIYAEEEEDKARLLYRELERRPREIL